MTSSWFLALGRFSLKPLGDFSWLILKEQLNLTNRPTDDSYKIANIIIVTAITVKKIQETMQFCNIEIVRHLL